MKNKHALVITSTIIAGSLLLAATAFAQSPMGGADASAGTGSGTGAAARANWQGGGRGPGGMGMMGTTTGNRPPGVFGTVDSINGSMLTVTSGFGGRGGGAASTTSTTTVYSVDASAATVMKDNATSSLSGIAVGDRVMVAGKISGTSVAAASIRDGVPQRGPGGRTGGGNGAGRAGENQPASGGFFGAIGGFFKRLFGFL